MDKQLVDYYQKQMDEISSLKRDRSQKLMDLVKHITTISFGMLTVLVTFKKNISISDTNNFLFSTIIILIGIGIISGIFYIHHLLDELNKIIKFQEESLVKRMNGDIKSIWAITLKTKWYFTFSKILFYLSSSLSVVFLIIYGIRI